MVGRENTLEGYVMVTALRVVEGWDFCKIYGHGELIGGEVDAVTCSRCGRSTGDTLHLRDLPGERQVTREAARFAPYVSGPLADAVADNLSAFSESRTTASPWRNLYHRDMVHNALEEVADQRAYVLAELVKLNAEERDDEDADRERMLLTRALGAAVEAYDALTQYERARRT